MAVVSSSASPYRLVRTAASPVAAPVLDPAQQEVVAHRGGPLLVLAGPGTGKTTTVVEAVVARIEAGADPEQVLVLTFGRRAAAELRGRITARLGRATKEPLARTFHSYAFGILRREAAARGEPAPRLLAGPEQDLVVRDLLAGDLEAGAVGWPDRLHAALGTRGFAQELRDLVMRAYERGVTADELDRLGRVQARDDWRAAARFMRQYAGVTALQDAASYDPAELIRAVVGLWLREPALLAAEQAARPHVFVDELQDTDPAQVELLTLLSGRGRDLVAVGDPDQSIYGFRGADVTGIREFRDRFRTADDTPAPVVALTTCRRSGSRCSPRAAGSRAVSAVRAGTATCCPRPGCRPASSRSPCCAPRRRRPPTSPPGCGTPTWSTACRGRRWRCSSGPPCARCPCCAARWSRPACRSRCPATRSRCVQEPAVRPLLLLLRCATRPEALDEDTAVQLLTSPLGGADVMGLRRLRQVLRRAELDAGGRRASGQLLVEALDDPRVLVPLAQSATRPAVAVATLLALAREAVAAPGATAEDVLWELWQRTGLAVRWERASREGGTSGEAADRDLDAVVALFETAARFCDRLPGAGPEVFLDHLLGQQIPGDEPAIRPVGDEAVQVLTAHASKGLEWDVVCVAGVQEGIWPDLRMRGSFLGSERLVDLLRPGGEPMATVVATAATLGRLLEEERRLFYVAITRARRALMVTAVTSEREALSPSRFLDEIDPLAGDDPRPLTPVRRPLSLTSLVAELRQSVTDPDVDDALRSAAAARLAALAEAGARGADPDSWWGLPALSDERPVRAEDESVAVSPSKVETFRRCELRWFLEHVGGGDTSGAAQSVGTLVHAVAESARTPETSTEEVLQARLQALLPTVDLGSGWVGRKEREKAEGMVRRLAGWLAANGREVVATELAFEAEVGRARLGGRVDRIERDADGRAVVVDLKTGASKVPADELPEHGQLATYQLAVEHGAFDGLAESGGAELVQVGKAGGKDFAVQGQEPLSASDDPGWARTLVLEVAEGMAGSAFRAVDNRYCTMCPVRTSCPVQDDGRAVTS